MTIYSVAVIAALLLFTSGPLQAQRCIQLQNASPIGLVSFLGATGSRNETSDCVAFAIVKLGEQRYAPAVTTLTKFFDFRWPVGSHQKQRLYVLEHDGGSIYPAATALEQMGKGALPAVLQALRSNTMSRESMEVAVSVWMTIYKDQALTCPRLSFT